MNKKELMTYFLSKPGSFEDYPFDEETAVLKVANKMFALINKSEDLSINLKCNPEYAEELRHIFNGVKPGYHMNKTHWNTIHLNSDVPDDEILKLIDHSYELVFTKLKKSEKEEILDIER